MAIFPDTLASARQLASAAGRMLPNAIERFLRRLIDGNLVVYPQVVIGTVTGGSSATPVVLGFTPDFVQITNITDYNAIFQWSAGMTNDTAVKLQAPASTMGQITSGGITPVSTAGSQGFSLGFNIAIAAKNLQYIAIKNRPTV